MPQPGTVHRDEPVDPASQLFVEQVPDAPQVAQTFFSDRANEGDVTGRPDVGAIEGADDRKHDCQPTAVVANTRAPHEGSVAGHADIGAFLGTPCQGVR